MKLSDAINYAEANYNTLPPVLQKSYDFITRVTNGGTDLESYKDSPTVKNTIDLAVSKFNELAAKGATKGPKTKAAKTTPKPPKAKTVVNTANQKRDTSILKRYMFDPQHPLMITNHASSQWKEAYDEFIEEIKTKDVKPGQWEKIITTQKTRTKSNNSNDRKAAAPGKENQVEHLPLEIVLMKRFVNMHDKEKTPDQVMSLLDAVQKAIIEKRVGKKSQFGPEIDEIQKRLIKCYNSMIGNKYKLIVIKIDTKLYDKIKGIVDSYEALKSVALIKRYINLDGKKQTKEKALKLKKDIQKILQTPDFYKDPYAKVLNEIELHLINYTTGVDKQLQIETQSLAGIPWVTIARKAATAASMIKSGASKIYDKAKPVVKKTFTATAKKANELIEKHTPAAKKAGRQIQITARKSYDKAKKALGEVEDTPPVKKEPEIIIPIDTKAAKLDKINSMFNNQPTKAGVTFKLYGDLGNFLGDLEQMELGITVEGDQGSGKTQLAYQMANGFLDLDKKVCFLCYELPHTSVPMKKFASKYLSAINQEKIKQKSDMPSGLAFIREIAAAFDVVIIDSWNKVKVKNKEFDDLRKEFPDTIFVILVQRLSSGDVRGGNDPKYDAGINIEVVKEDSTFVNNYAFTSKNRYGASGLKYNIANQKLI